MKRATQPRKEFEAAMQHPNVFGLSLTEMRELIAIMEGVARIEGFGEGHHVSDIVQNAFVMALSKPISERPSIGERKKFIAWMCTLARFAAMTSRNETQVRTHSWLVEEHAHENVDDILEGQTGVHTQADAIEAREFIKKATNSLDGAELKLVAQHVLADEYITEMAAEQGVPATTLYERYYVIINKIRARIAALEHVPHRVHRNFVPFVVTSILIRDAQAAVRHGCMKLVETFARFALRFVMASAAGMACLTVPLPGTPQTSTIMPPIPLPVEAAATMPVIKRQHDSSMETPVHIELPKPLVREGIPQAPKARPAKQKKKVDTFDWREWVRDNEKRRRTETK